MPCTCTQAHTHSHSHTPARVNTLSRADAPLFSHTCPYTLTFTLAHHLTQPHAHTDHSLEFCSQTPRQQGAETAPPSPAGPLPPSLLPLPGFWAVPVDL